MMRIDSHQHFWHYNQNDYVWMDDSMDVLRRDHTPDDLYPLLGKVGIEGTVAVQARQILEETQYLLDLARDHAWILGIVGWFDFSSYELEAQIERLCSYAKLKGARELIHDMPDDRYAVSPEHLNGVGLLGKYGLTYDLLLRPRHIEPATELVDSYPGQLFVIDHIAKPDIAGRSLSPWRERMREIALRPNVYCKLSGMVTEAQWNDWTQADFEPYIDSCLELFGPQRLMVGSDWPVCTLSGSYESVMGIVLDYVKRLTASEQAAVLGDTCARFYGLAPIY